MHTFLDRQLFKRKEFWIVVGIMATPFLFLILFGLLNPVVAKWLILRPSILVGCSVGLGLLAATRWITWRWAKWAAIVTILIAVLLGISRGLEGSPEQKVEAAKINAARVIEITTSSGSTVINAPVGEWSRPIVLKQGTILTTVGTGFEFKNARGQIFTEDAELPEARELPDYTLQFRSTGNNPVRVSLIWAPYQGK